MLNLKRPNSLIVSVVFIKAHEGLMPRTEREGAEQFWDRLFPEEFQARTGKRTYLMRTVRLFHLVMTLMLTTLTLKMY